MNEPTDPVRKENEILDELLQAAAAMPEEEPLLGVPPPPKPSSQGNTVGSNGMSKGFTAQNG